METNADAKNTPSLDFYLVAGHGTGRGSFLVYLSLLGLWASEGESWANQQQTNARLASLQMLEKFKKMGGKYTGLTVDSLMREVPGQNTLSLKIPIIRLVRDPLRLMASVINYNRLIRFLQGKLFQTASCTLPSAETECADFFSAHGPKLLSHESIFQCLKHHEDVRVADTSETLPEHILATLERVTEGFSPAPYNPQDQRFYKSYGTGENLILDHINGLKLTDSRGIQATVKVWPDYLSYRLVLWRNIPAKPLAKFGLKGGGGQIYHAFQLFTCPEEAGFVFQPEQHLPALASFTQNFLNFIEAIMGKYAPHHIGKEMVIAAIRNTPKLYDTFMDYWEKEWSPIEKISPGHIQKWWKNSLEIVSGPAVKQQSRLIRPAENTVPTSHGPDRYDLLSAPAPRRRRPNRRAGRKWSQMGS